MSFSTKKNIKMKTEGKSPNALSTKAQKSSRIAINSAFENINSVLESILEKFASEKPIPFPPENTFSLIDKKAYTKLLDENKRLREKIKKSEEKSARNAKGVNLSIESNDELKFDLTETTSKIDQKGRKTTDSTGEINLKILIEKESAIRDLRFKIDHLQSENKKLTEQKLILQRIGQPAKNETLRTIGKSANIYGPKTQRYFKKSKEKLPAQNSLWKPRNSVVGHKKESTDKFLLKNGKTATKKPLIITNEKAKNFERSVSEPRSKIQAKPYKTPVRSSIKKRLKFAKASDDAILSTIKFKKTRSLFGNVRSRNKHVAKPKEPVKKVVNQPVVRVASTGKQGKDVFKTSSSARLNEAFLILSDKKELWQERIRVMSVIDQIIVRRKVKVSRDQLYLLKNVLIVQIYDLRSIVVKEVCKLVNNLSKTIPEQISLFFGAYLNALFSRVYNSIRAIRDPCTDSVRTLVRNIADTRCVKELLNYSTDPHPEVRKLSIELIGWCLDLSVKEKNDKIDKHRMEIQFSIIGMLRDANKSVRRSADSTFTSFAKKWPAQAQSAFDKLAPSDKKLISANL